MSNATSVLSPSAWSKLILRWTELEPTGEVRLLAAALGQWINERQVKAANNGFDPDYSGVTGRAMESVCMALGIDRTFFFARLREGWDGRAKIAEHRRANRETAEDV